MNKLSRSFIKICKHCFKEFEGNYNSLSCPTCKKIIKERALLAFKKRNPTYGKNQQAKRRADGRHLKTILRQQYGIDVTDYEALLKEQNNRCAICSSPAGGWKANARKLVIDHCHKSNIVRGLLCPSCNRGLGQFEDNPLRLLEAAKYICRHKHKGKPVEDIDKAIDCLIKYRDNLKKEMGL